MVKHGAIRLDIQQWAAVENNKLGSNKVLTIAIIPKTCRITSPQL